MNQTIQGSEEAVGSNDVELRTPNHDYVAARAYDLWISRGCPIGSPETDWFQAEAELNQIKPLVAKSQAA